MKTSKTNWIKDAVNPAHKGRCANPGSKECPKGSPQFNLAMTFKKHHGFHSPKSANKK